MQKYQNQNLTLREQGIYALLLEFKTKDNNVFIKMQDLKKYTQSSFEKITNGIQSLNNKDLLDVNNIEEIDGDLKYHISLRLYKK